MRYKTPKLYLTLFFIILAVFLCGCQSNTQVFNIIMPQAISTIDPQYATTATEKTIAANIFTTLARYSKDGKAQLHGANEYYVSEDKLLHEFRLRKDIFWSNGSAVSANDYVYALERVLRGSPYENELSSLGLKSEATDTYTLKIILETPTANLLPIFTEIYTSPCNKEFLAQTKGRYGRSTENILSCGKYTLGYMSDSLVTLNSAKNDKLSHSIRISIEELPDQTRQLEMLKDGTLDIAMLSTQANVDTKRELSEIKDINIAVKENTTTLLAFNTKSNFFKNLKLREAFIPSQNISENLPSSILPPSIYAKSSEIFTPKSSNIALFREGLMELGISELPSVKFISIASQKSIAMEYAREKNRAFGTLMSPQILTEAELTNTLQNGDFDIAIYSLTGSTDNVLGFLSYFSTNNTKNFTNISSDEYDKAVTNGDVHGAEKILSEGYYVFPIDYPPTFLAINKDLPTATERAGVYYFS